MPTFQALTNASALGEGVKLNLMATPQTAGVAPPRLASGARVTVRFGHCCPDIAEGTVTAVTGDLERAVLTLGDTHWTIERGPSGSGVSVPGILSEDWYVR